MEWTITVIVLFLVSLAGFSALCETYAPKVLAWMEKQVTR